MIPPLAKELAKVYCQDYGALSKAVSQEVIAYSLPNKKYYKHSRQCVKVLCAKYEILHIRQCIEVL